MSGGVDSAVAALLVGRGGREAVAVTLELWADPDNDAEASCCSAHAVPGRARASRTGWGCRTSRSTCATSSAPASSSRSWPGTRRA